MATVLDVDGKPHEVDDDLYADFLHDTVVAIEPTDVREYFSRLNAQACKSLSDYIVWRLAEVDPGHFLTVRG